MKEELNRKQELLDTLSSSLQTELDASHLSLVRMTYLQEKIELLREMSAQKKSTEKNSGSKI